MKRLDVRGEVCPMPVLKTKKAMEEISEGEILEIILDYPPSRENVRRFLLSQGHEIIEMVEEGGLTRIKARKRKEAS
jgi:tRNA 2-thiouridine synthesizing protein A